MDVLVLIPFIAYFLLVIGIGIYATKFSSKGISEFFVGGRQMGRLVVALSAVVSGRSAWLLLGFTGLAYCIGYPAIWTAIGYIVIEFLLFMFYAPRIRRFSEKNNCITVTDFFASRFDDKKGHLRIIIVAIFIIFMVTYVAAQFVAGGKAFSAYFEISATTGVILTAAIILVYTILGGFLAVSLTDVLQAFFMIVALVGLPLYGIIEMGGWDAVTNKLAQFDQLTKSGEVLSGTFGKMLSPFSLSTLGIIGALGIGLGSPGSPHIIVRYMSIKDPSQFNWTAFVGTFWNIIMAAGALYIGLVGRAYFPDMSILPDGDRENIYISLANTLLHPSLVGLLLASIFAAIMSTADSQLLVAASSIVRDIYQKIIKKNVELSQKRLALLSRIVISLLVIVAILLGIWVKDLVFWFVLFAWAGLGAAIGPTSILALFWKRTTKTGVIVGLLSGTVTVFVWKNVEVLKGLIYELVPGFFIALMLTIIVSLIDKKGLPKEDDQLRS
jgi:sodium/proline symporter